MPVLHRSLARSAIFCLLALLPAAACASGPAGAAGTPACASSGLVAWLDTQGNGAAGTVFYELKFTNLSGRTCHLRGFPGVSAVDLAGHRVGRAASRSHATRVRTIVLAHGATATATLQIVEAGNFSPSACHQVTAAGLRVFPPNQTASKVVPF